MTRNSHFTTLHQEAAHDAAAPKGNEFPFGQTSSARSPIALASASACSSAPATTALCAALALGEAASAPEWVHLLPAGEIRTRDGRGPYRVADMQALIAASLAGGGERLVIDENHATDLAAPRGGAAPARGWITALEARADGLWGRVEWTDEGRRLVESKSYRGLSPAIMHDAKGNVLAVLRAALVNLPNLRGLAALNSQEQPMDLTKLRKALGLSADADEVACMAAVGELKKKAGENAAAMASALSPIAEAVGLEATVDAAAVLAGVQAKLAATAPDDATITALQSELASVTTRLNALTEQTAREKAAAFVDAAIKAGRVGVRPLRERYIAMHMKNPSETEELVGAMPIVGASGALAAPPARAADGKIALNAEQAAAAKLLGLSAENYAKTLQGERATEEAN